MTIKSSNSRGRKGTEMPAQKGNSGNGSEMIPQKGANGRQESVYETISFQALIENAPDGIALVDAKGELHYISPSARRMFGYLPDEQTRISPVESTHPDDLEMVLRNLGSVIKNPELKPCIEYRFRHSDGSYKWIESTISNMLEMPGIKSLVINFRDISERKKGEEKFRNLLELATDAFFQGDLKGDFLMVNTRATELTGYSRDELTGMNISRLFSDTELERKPLNYDELKKGALIKSERLLKRKDNTLVDIEMHSRAMPDGTYQTFIRDISERKKADAELEKQRMFFEQMFLQSATSTQILDPEGWCLRVNPKLCELFCVTAGDIEGKKYNIFRDSEITGKGIDKLLKKVFEEHQVVEWEIFFDIRAAADSVGIRVKQDKKAWFLNKAYPILDGNGNLLNVIIQHEDISERKLVEEQLKIKEEQLLTLINTTTDIICFKDGKGRWLQANKADLELFGLTDVDYYHKTDRDLASLANPLYREAFENCLQSDELAWEKGSLSVGDELIPAATGEQLTYEIIKTPLFNDDGSRKGLVVFGRNVSERKIAEQALIESENKYRQIVEYSPDAIVIHANNKILFANPATLRIFGADSFKELSSRPLMGYVHPDYAEMALKRIQTSVATGSLSDFAEEKFLKLDGTAIDVEVAGIPIKYMGIDATQVIVRDISGRKQAMEALKESEDRFRKLAESAPYAIMIYQDDRWVYTNPEGERISGYSAKELYKMNFWELGEGEYQTLVKERGKRRQGGLSATPSYEFKLRAKDGSIKWVFLSGNTVMYKGKSAGIISVIEITERKKAEEAILRERLLLRTLIDNLPDTIYFKDTECRKIVANRADLQLFGFTEESQVLGKTDVDLLGQEAGRRGYQDDLHVIRTGLPLINSEDDITDASGRVRWMLTSKIPLHDENFNVTGLVGIGHDITERRHSERIQRVLFQISNAVLLTSDLDELFYIIREELGTLLDTTNFYIAFYDEETDMLSTPVYKDEKDNIPEWPASKSATGYVIRSKKALLADKGEIKRMCDEGTLEIIGELCQVWLGVPLLVEGKAIGAIVVQDYNNPAAYSQKDVEMLEFVSHQISLSIQRKKAEQDLRQALTKAEESDRLKTAFLNNMSHEIRTPLNGILGFTSLLGDPDTTPEDQQYFYRIINQNGEQLLSIINDIISIATIEAGQEKVREGKSDVNAMMAMLYEQFRLQGSNKQLLLNYRSSLSSEEAAIRTDETKLRQILTNLIGNALKFTDQGLVEFGCRRDGELLEFFVSDTGVGIPAEMHKVVFERFRQVNFNPMKEYGGNGLGLAISKAYAELLGGRIWLESAPGKGSTFWFTIAYKPAEILTEPVKTYSPGHLPSLRGKGRTILVAEDVYANFQLLDAILRKMEFTVVHVENGLEAVEACRNRADINLVLMDIKMPEMDGYEATGIIKLIRPGLPVIAVTAYALGGDKEKALAAGCDDYITKPVKSVRLTEVLERYLPPDDK